MIDAIQRDARDERVFIRRIDSVLRRREGLLVVRLLPDMRQRPLFRCTNIDGVFEYVRLVNVQIQDLHTVATVNTRHRVTVLTGRPERIMTCRVFFGLLVVPCMAP